VSNGISVVEGVVEAQCVCANILGSRMGNGRTYERSQPGAKATNKDKSYPTCQQIHYNRQKVSWSLPFMLRECREPWCDEVRFSRLRNPTVLQMRLCFEAEWLSQQGMGNAVAGD
jgi:hypothetical protein